jgi:hypothetical protein
MTTYKHSYANKVIISTRLQWPNPGTPQCILVIEANIPLSEKIEGYDSIKLGSLIDFVLETMEKAQAEKAEVYPISEPDVSYVVSRDSITSLSPAGP